MDNKLLSIIIPTYNAADCIKQAIHSVLNCPYSFKFEIIVVDDCSKDDSYEIVQELSKEHSNIISLRMPENSGSPSKPRNMGIENAKGKFIFFLDDDDMAEPDRLHDAVMYADKNDLDFLKGYLKVVKNNGISEANRLKVKSTKKLSLIENLIENTSTNMFVILKREFILKNDIRFDPMYKIGEDTLITAKIFSCKPKLDYIDDYFVFYNKKADVTNLSSTQNYGDKELNDHIEVWKLSEQLLNKVGLSYFKLRLSTAVKNTITSIVDYSRGNISREIFTKLSQFVNSNKKQIEQKLVLHARFNEVWTEILKGDYEAFLDVSKRRILINGYDLKFALPIVKYLEKDFKVEIDEWRGHNSHDAKRSHELLNWADVLFCEWMLGNAVWYSKNKLNFQTLIVRAHRFEIQREFGEEINMKRVDAVIAVSYYYVEKFAARFNIPKHKMHLLSNYVEEDIYKKNKTKGAEFNICIAGILPARKGYFRGLELLKGLREVDDRFRLVILGSHRDSVDWISKNPTEKEYFDRCESYISANRLDKFVDFAGFLDRDKMFDNVNYVLSLSDALIPESFHLAPAEALVDDTAAMILYWQGVEYIYPSSLIYSTLEDIKNKILELSKDKKAYKEYTEKNKEFVLNNYSMSTFTEGFRIIIEKTILSK